MQMTIEWHASLTEQRRYCFQLNDTLYFDLLNSTAGKVLL